MTRVRYSQPGRPASASCSQQFELYAAEEAVGRGGGISARGLQGYVDDLRDSPYWQRNFPQVLRIETHVRASDRRGSVGKWLAGQGAGLIEMAPCHLCELFVLHEVAHVLAEARYGSRSHDPWFARTYLELVYAALGSAPYAALRAALDRAGVDHQADSAVPAGRPL